MNKFSEPLDHILNCCQQGLLPTDFDILNAKDQLRKLKDQINELITKCHNANISAREDRARWLDAEKDRAKLYEENKLLNESLSTAVAWSRINERGDLYDLRVCHNPYVDQTTVLPLYSNKEEFKKLTNELKERLTS